MVQLIPDNPNPTMADINAYIREMRAACGGGGGDTAAIAELMCVVREIHCKSGAGALLHPAEDYFLEQATRSVL
jgi:hypothetical protein